MAGAGASSTPSSPACVIDRTRAPGLTPARAPPRLPSPLVRSRDHRCHGAGRCPAPLLPARAPGLTDSSSDGGYAPLVLPRRAPPRLPSPLVRSRDQRCHGVGRCPAPLLPAWAPGLTDSSSDGGYSPLVPPRRAPPRLPSPLVRSRDQRCHGAGRCPAPLLPAWAPGLTDSSSDGGYAPLVLPRRAPPRLPSPLVRSRD